jgi:hypothetical protein
MVSLVMPSLNIFLKGLSIGFKVRSPILDFLK